MNKKTLKYIKRLHPYLDKENKFIFMGNPKTALKSMTHGILYDRIIVRNKKNHKKDWHEKIDTYTIKNIENIFKFTFVRNPYDRTVSAFFFLKQIWQSKKHRKELIIKNDETFEDFIINKFSVQGTGINLHFLPQHRFVTINNIMFIDFIGKFENLTNDWKYVASKINANPNLPHINKSNHKNYKDYYTEETKQIVAKIYEKDIKLFNYKF